MSGVFLTIPISRDSRPATWDESRAMIDRYGYCFMIVPHGAVPLSRAEAIRKAREWAERASELDPGDTIVIYEPAGHVTPEFGDVLPAKEGGA